MDPAGRYPTNARTTCSSRRSRECVPLPASPGGPGEPAKPGPPVADVCSGLYAALSILAMLCGRSRVAGDIEHRSRLAGDIEDRNREKRREGSAVRVSLFD